MKRLGAGVRSPRDSKKQEAMPLPGPPWRIAPRRVYLRLLASALALGALPLHAQIDSEPQRGLRDATPRVHALTGARVFVTPTRVLDSATIVLRDGRVEAVGPDVAVPADARVWDLRGHIVYPGFIDPMSKIGLPGNLRPPPTPKEGEKNPPPPPRPPEFSTGDSNSMIRPETDTASVLDLDDKAIRALRELGITAALAVPRRGVLRGQSALVLMSDAEHARRAVLASRVAQHAANELRTAPDDTQYPSSLMGVIALLRQTLYDARWYRDMQAYYGAHPNVERAAENSALAALAPVVSGKQRLVYATDDELDYARVRVLQAEFGLDVVLYGNGHEYRRPALLAGLRFPVIVPLDFPEPPDIDSPDGALDVTLEALEHWELAPSNAAFLAKAGVPFAFTADKLEKPAQELWRNIRLAVQRGLPEQEALAALTTRPADALGVADKLGTLERGRIANLVVADADPFVDKNAKIDIVFVDGAPYELDAYRSIDPKGRWNVTSARGGGEWTIGAVDDKKQLTVTIAGSDYRGRLDGPALLLFPGASVFGATDGLARMTGYVADRRIEGLVELPDGTAFAWSATYAGEPEQKPANEDAAGEIPPLDPRPYPAGAFGVLGEPEQPSAILVRGATIWTSSARGKLENADLLVRNGRIAAVGTGLDAPRGAVVIDATGKHVTAGLIDAHSHTAISGPVNETGSAVTDDVRIADVLNPTDINVYRHLAGGLTVANVLHGSANPIGGQNQIIKLRWGGDAARFVLQGAPPGVKFALGENVKQSNWGDRYTTRYPQTRMGVEQIIRDTLVAARRYGEERAKRDRNDPPLRRDLKLDAVIEMLDGRRAIHIHSYRQDEILAFIRVAQEFGLHVATFQHVLEGYKVAPEIKSIGAGGSTFSDWWGYKAEVLDAIPYNGALMREAGVVVSFNSDDDELATRLNTEAAKTVKYGGVPEEAALDFVTINPAIQLGIDGRVGSLEPGKDADFVIWSGPPLSVISHAEQTWIDGRRYFDSATDARMRTATEAERARLIQKALAARTKASGGEKPGAKPAAQPASGVRLYTSSARRSDEKEQLDE
jgi:imidazolonepropionase-like amidohydrolase